MSYDVSIGDFHANYTFNVSGLFYDHIPDMGAGGGLRELDGLTGKQAVARLAKAFDNIDGTILTDWVQEDVGEPVFCARYDSDNGWGSTVGALVFLAQMAILYLTNPK